MKLYTVDGWNNFCRVFMLPEKFSQKYCFGGSVPTNFQMVDWFYPVQGIALAACTKEIYTEKFGPIPTKHVTMEHLEETLIPFLLKKNYVIPGRKYIVLFDFGGAITFTGE